MRQVKMTKAARIVDEHGRKVTSLAYPINWSPDEGPKIDSFSDSLQALMQRTCEGNGARSGGSHTPNDLRLLLYALTKLQRCETVCELGFDAGSTSVLLCETGAYVYAVDNSKEYPEVKPYAIQRLASYENCTIVLGDALKFLENCADDMLELIFVDDYHHVDHVRKECQQIRRVLKSGGIAAFHDIYLGDGDMWDMIKEELAGWWLLPLNAYSPDSGVNFGVGLAKKP